MRTSSEVLLALAYFMRVPPVAFSIPYLAVSVFTGNTMISESTTSSLLDKSLSIRGPQSLRSKTHGLCATNITQEYQVPLSLDDDPSDGPVSSSPRPILIKHLYKSGHSKRHPELCPSQGEQIRVLILVTSTPANTEIRYIIRQTWGRYQEREDVAIAFVLGKPPTSLEANLTAEDQVYRDLVIGHSVDQYWSLPLKTISLLEWANTYCPKSSFVFKCDDDVFVNIPVLLDFINDPKILDAKKTIFGNIRQKLLTNRDPEHKHYIPKEEYPKASMPDFLGGPAYMLTRDAVLPLLDAVCDQHFVRIEDVFITGILAGSVGIKIQHEAEFNSDKMPFLRPVTDLCKRIATHPMQRKQMLKMWLQIYDNPDVYRQNEAPKPIECVAPNLYQGVLKNKERVALSEIF